MTPTAHVLGVAIIVAIAITLGYIGICYDRPFARCIACRLTPADHSCRWCRGTGLRLRLLWRAVNFIRRAHIDAQSGKHRKGGPTQ